MTPDDRKRLRELAEAALRWSTGHWFVFDNQAKAPHVPVEIRQSAGPGVEGGAPMMRQWQELPCDECGGDHVNGAERWHIAEMTKVTHRYHGCGRKAARDAYQSVRDEAAHIASANPAAVLALLDQIEAVERERDHMRDAIIALAGDVYDGVRDHRIVIRAYREAANHLAEPFSIDKVERLVREAKERT